MADDASLLKPLLLVCACAALAPLAAQAEVYKWVDERGVVNYSSSPPPGDRKATVLPPDNPAVTVVPAPRLPKADADARRLHERIERLEEEASRKASERHAEAETQARLEQARRLQCELDRVVDCEPEWWEMRYPSVVVGVRPPPFRSPHFRLRPLPRHKAERDFRLAPALEKPDPRFADVQRGMAGGR